MQWQKQSTVTGNWIMYDTKTGKYKNQKEPWEGVPLGSEETQPQPGRKQTKQDIAVITIDDIIERYNEEPIWKPIPDYEGMYEICHLGYVRNVTTGAIHNMFVGKNNWLKVTLKNQKTLVSKQFLIHKLVATMFIGNCKGIKLYVVHKDEDYMNNHVDNLEYQLKAEMYIKKKVNDPTAFKTSSQESGVIYSKRFGRYKAILKFDNTRHHLGWFDTKAEAEKIYQDKKKELYSEYLVLS